MGQISSVGGNADKQRTYREMLGRYKTALREGFYFEALIIDYSMLEDRFRSFLYYIGALRNRQSYKFDVNVVKEDIKPIVMQYSERKNPNFRITSLDGKMQIIKATLQWACEVHQVETGGGFLSVLKSEYEGLDIGGLLQTIELIEKWKSYRNEVIHALMNKNIDSLYSELFDKAEEGMLLARFIDGQIKILKKKNKVRKFLGLTSTG